MLFGEGHDYQSTHERTLKSKKQVEVLTGGIPVNYYDLY